MVCVSSQCQLLDQVISASSICFNAKRSLGGKHHPDPNWRCQISWSMTFIDSESYLYPASTYHCHYGTNLIRSEVAASRHKFICVLLWQINVTARGSWRLLSIIVVIGTGPG